MYRRHHRTTAIAIGAFFAIVLGAGSPAGAAITAEKCFANKAKAWGKLRECQRGEEAKAILGRRAEPTKCQRAFDDTFEGIAAKATRAGIVCRFVDNGDNTVTDFDAGLMWARLSGLNGVPSTYVLDADNRYDWEEAYRVAGVLNGTSPNGSVEIPLPGFPPYRDWRLPTIVELTTIVDCSFVSPCFRPEVGATMAGVHYWSSTADGHPSALAWARVLNQRGDRPDVQERP